MEKEIFPQIINDTDRFYGFKFKGYWIDIGRISSYIEIHKHLLNKNNMSFLRGENSEIYGSLKNSVVGENVFIGKNSKLESSIVYDNVRIEQDVVLSNCVIGENSRIGRNSDIKNSVIGDNETIKDNDILDNKAVWTQPVPKGYPDKQIGNPIENK